MGTGGFLRLQVSWPVLLGMWWIAFLGNVGSSAAETGAEAIPYVLSASRLSQPLSEAPAAVTVITREMIRATGAREIADLLRLVPGFQVAYFRGNQPIVTYHGMSGDFTRRMQVLIDGRPVYNPVLGEVYWGDLGVALEDVERIEVLRGPNGATYGANAFLAVISIYTRAPELDHETSAKLAAGQRDYAYSLLRTGGSLGPGHARASLGWKEDGGLPGVPGNARTFFGNGVFGWQPGVRDDISVRAGFSQGPRSTGFESEFYQREHSYLAHNAYLQAQWHRVLDSRSEFTLQAAHSEYRWDERYFLDLPRPIGRYEVGMDWATQRDAMEFEYTRQWLPDLRTAAGVGWRRDRAQSMSFFSVPQLSGDLVRLFANIEWHAQPTLVLHLGANSEHHFITGTTTAPRAAANWEFRPDQTLRISVARGYRSPTLVENFGNQAFTWNGHVLDQTMVPPQSALRPENALARELGYVAEFREAGISVDARIFNDHIYDLIGNMTVDLPPGTELLDNDTARTRWNGDRITISGAELCLGWRGREAWARYCMNAQKADSTSRDMALSMPRNSHSLIAAWDFAPRWQTSINAFHSAPVLWLGNGDYIEGLSRLDLRLAHRFGAHERNELALVSQNLLGDSQNEIRQDQWFPRRTSLELSLAF